MEKAIITHYPNAREGMELTSTCMEALTGRFGFNPEKTLLATSVCSDEIIRSATNFRGHLNLVSPFQLGGLAGYPFTGLTGLKAFASHIPDQGGAIILYGPHIGVSSSGEIGVMKRVGQNQETSCCGALHATLAALQKSPEPEADPDLDHQMWKIESELLPERDQLLLNHQPLVELTNAMYRAIDRQMEKLIVNASNSLSGYKIALVGGIIINTDFNQPDWFDLRRSDLISETGERTPFSFL